MTNPVTIQITVNPDHPYMNYFTDFTLTCQPNPAYQTPDDYYKAFSEEIDQLSETLETKWNEALDNLTPEQEEALEEDTDYKCRLNDFTTVPLPEHAKLIQDFKDKWHPSLPLDYGYDNDYGIHGLGTPHAIAGHHQKFPSEDEFPFWEDICLKATFV